MSTTDAAAAKQQHLFRDLDPDDDDPEITELESLCLSCYKQGTTKLMLTKIPHFKEVIISSFHCESCGYSDRSIQSAGRIQDRGVKYELTLNTEQDLNRQVVKSDKASFAIPHLEFEQPPSQKGDVTTVEGLLDSVIRGLRLMQPQRQEVDPENAEKIEEFIKKMEMLKKLEQPFQIILSDPSGNSFVENPLAPKRDPSMEVTHYVRTREQEIGICGMAEDTENAVGGEDSELRTNEVENVADEVMTFRTNCPNCNIPCDTNMKMQNIPFFKQVVIMATVCDVCGHKDNEVKAGAGIEPKGTRITLHVTDVSDLNRDLLKSDTCSLMIPELELETQMGTLGGRFTTVEGLMVQVKEQLSQTNPFLFGDSSISTERIKLTEFCAKLDKYISGEVLDFHLVLDDPAGNSYLQNLYAPDPDPEMTVEHYERNFAQREALGLNDMKTENYTEEKS